MLLKLIEMMEGRGIDVVSANTDGIICRFPKELRPDFEAVWQEWESLTSLELEETGYRALCNQSVNSYFAVKLDGTYKGKGTFGPLGIGIIDVAPWGHICGEAVMAYVANGTPIERTIMACRDIREFVFLQKVTGGCEYEMEDIGGSVRWYRGTEWKLPMCYIKSGNNVPTSANAVLALDLPEEFPEDLDYRWYIDEAYRTLESIGWQG